MSMEDDNVINIKAFKHRVERQVVTNFMRRGEVIPEKDMLQLQETLLMFEQHGIGALEAFDIMQELTRIYSK